MSRSGKLRSLLTLLFLVAATSGLTVTRSSAQGLGTRDDGPGGAPASVYTIDSDPVRADAVLRGRSSFQGTLPLSIPGDLTGEYQLDLTAAGYATQRVRIQFPGSFGGSPELRSPRNLDPGTLVRALVWPGFAQLTEKQGDDYRGRGFAAAGGIAITGLLSSELRRRTSEDDATAAAEGTTESRDLATLTQAEIDLARALGGGAAAEDARRNWAIMAATAWGLSLFDTFLLSPRQGPAEVDFTDIRFELRPLSRRQAFFRSLIPGLGQYYAGRRLAGALAFYGTLGAVTGLISSENSFNQATLRLDRLEALYADPLADPEEVAIYRAAAADQAETADDRRTQRNVMIGITAAVWAINLADAILSTPGPDDLDARARGAGERRGAGPQLGLDAGSEVRGPGLALNLTF